MNRFCSVAEKYKSKDSTNINAETLRSSLCGQCERVKAKLVKHEFRIKFRINVITG